MKNKAASFNNVLVHIYSGTNEVIGLLAAFRQSVLDGKESSKFV